MNHITKTFLVLAAAAVVFGGCSVNVPDQIVADVLEAPTKNIEQPKPIAADSKKRFGTNATGQNNYEDVRSWAEKNRELRTQNAHLKKINDELTADNKRLNDRFDAMKLNLETAEKELADANEMLIEMRKELDNWKTNVLSFREESNYIHKEQLKALVKILKLLGAEQIELEEE